MNVRITTWIVTGLLAGFAAASSTPGTEGPRDRPGPASSVGSKLADSTAQLKHAADLRAALRGTEGEVREAARAHAVEAYRLVREHFPKDVPACAEAAFRAGELLRASPEPSSSLSEFKIARERGAGTPWKVRATLEIGQVERRAKHYPEAMAAFEAAVADAHATQGQRDDGALWMGRTLLDGDRFDDARRTWQRVAESAEDPLDRIRAYDWTAQALVERQDLEGAAGVLARCREALHDAAEEESKLGERVRHALDNLQAAEDLARAVAKRASKDGADEENGKKKQPARGGPAK